MHKFFRYNILIAICFAVAIFVFGEKAQAASGSITQSDNGVTSTGYNLDGSSNVNTIVTPPGTSGADASVVLDQMTTIERIQTDDTANTANSVQQGGWANRGSGAFVNARQNAKVGNGSSVGLFGKMDRGANFTQDKFINFATPKKVASDSVGNLYIMDTSGRDYVKKFDANWNFIAGWGVYGSGNGEFIGPESLALDSSDNVYVVDSQNKNVQKFDSNGNFIRRWGGAGTNPGQFNYPTGIAIDSANNVYVVDFIGSSIQKFDANGNFLSYLGTEGYDDGQFMNPRDVAIDSANNVYVADYNNFRVQKFNSSGVFQMKWGTRGAGDGEFNGAADIAIDANDYIYVLDRGYENNHRIQKFNSSGAYQGQWDSDLAGIISVVGLDVYAIYYGPNGQGEINRIVKYNTNGVFQDQWDGSGYGLQYIAIDSADNVYVANGRAGKVYKFDSNGNFLFEFGSYGTGDGQFQFPIAMATDSADNVYVVDYYVHRVQKFNSSGVYQTQWGSEGSGNGQFSNPHGIAIDSANSVYVADTGNNRIQKFNSSGVYQTQWGSLGSGEGNFDWPGSVDTDSSNNVYVLDFSNNRIQKFTSGGSFLGIIDEVTYPNSMVIAADDSLFVDDWWSNTIYKLNSAGKLISTSDPGYWSTSTLAVDSQNKVFSGGGAGVDAYIMTFDGSSNLIPSSGTYVSYVDAGTSSLTWDNLTWNGTYPAGTSLSIKVKASSSSNAAPNFSSNTCDALNQTADSTIILNTTCAPNDNRYLWYEVTFTGSTEPQDTPLLNSVAANGMGTVPYYPAAGTFTSGFIDPGQDITSWGNLSWTETGSQTIHVLVRSSATLDFAGASNWLDCLPITNGNPVADGGCVVDGDRYVQYQAVLSTADSSSTPSLDSLTLGYNYAGSSSIAISTLMPNDNDAGVATNANLVVTFDQLVTAVAGKNIVIKKTSGDSVVETIPATDPRVSVNDSQISINPAAIFRKNTGYYVQIDAGAFVNGGNSFPGIADKTTWNFTTRNAGTIIIDPDATKIGDAYTAGDFSLNSGTLEDTDQASVTTDVSLERTTVSADILATTTITRTGGGNLNLSQLNILDVTSSYRTDQPTTRGVVDFGIPNIGLTFSNPITLSVSVGNQYNGQTLTILYQNDGELIWTPNETQATCLVAGGECAFETTHATRYTVNGDGTLSGADDINLELQINAGISLMCYDSGSATDDHAVSLGTITQDGQATGGEATCNVRTNNNAGYSLAISSVGNLTSGSGDTITAYTNTPAAWSIPVTDSAWGYHAKSTSAITTTSWGADTNAGNWAGGDNTLGSKNSESPSAGDDNYIMFTAEIGTSKIQPSGTYQDTVTVTATTL